MGKKILDSEQESQIIKSYKDGALVKDLRIQYGFKTNKSIYDLLKKNDVKIRSFEETISIKAPGHNISFSLLDSPIKAYFVGLMVTDGWICDNYIGLSMADKDVIDFICNFFSKESKIIKKSGNRKLQYRFGINSDRIVSELSRFGIVERKSRILQPPKFKKSEIKFLSYFIRGVIDGDGWIRKDGKEFFICSASKDFIVWLKKVFESYYKFYQMNITHGDNGIWCLRTSDDRNLFLLFAHIYYFPFGMARKYNILEKRFRDYNGRS